MKKITVLKIGICLSLSLAPFTGAPLFATDIEANFINTFFGLSTEFIMYPTDTSAPLASVTPESINLMATFGDRHFFKFLPLRARGGFGFWPGRYFSTNIGLELAFLEILNQSQARMLGIYGFVDGIMRIGSTGVSLAARPSIHVLIPLSPIGGVNIGCGYDTEFGLTWHLDYFSGFYALK